jgi:hypothetical protein
MAWYDIPGFHSSARANHGRIARIVGEVHAVTREILEAVTRAAAISSGRNKT